MTANDCKVLLDLNAPSFQNDLFGLDADEVRKLLKTLKKLRGLTWNEVFRDHGLHWEEVRSMPGRYTIRLSQSCRAVVMREGAWMRLAPYDEIHIHKTMRNVA